MQAADCGAGKPGRADPCNACPELPAFRPPSGSARRPHKIHNTVAGLPSRAAFDPAGRIDGVGMNDTDGFPDVLWSEASGQDHLPGGLSHDEFTRKVPVNAAPRAAVSGLRPGVEQEIGGVV